MRLTTSTPFVALFLGVTGNPVNVARDGALACQYNDIVAQFDMWTSECGGSGHTWGTRQIDRAWANLCFPLHDNTHALGMTHISEGCRITAFESATCDDYPWNGTYIAKEGCLWASDTQYKSFQLSCDK